MLSKQVAQQSCVCPGKHILNTHTIWDVSAEALSDVLCQKVSVGVPLTVRHQEQHPHKSHVDCIINKYLTFQIVLLYIMFCYVLSWFSYQESPLLEQRLSALWSCCSSSSRCQWEVAADRNCRYCLFLLRALRHDHLMRVILDWCVLFFRTEVKIENCEKKKYLCFSDCHLSEALRTPPGQLSSEREQRKQQIQEPVREDFFTFQ